MTIPFWCLIVAVAMPYVLAGVGGYFKVKQFGSLDIATPRVQAAQLEGLGARVQAAQDNAWEALGVIITAVLVAHLAGADPAASANAAMLIVVGRVLHPIMYMINIGPLRTLSFIVSLSGCIWLFVLAAKAV